MWRRQREKFHNEHVSSDVQDVNKAVNTKVPQLAGAKVKTLKPLANGASVRNPNER